MFLFKHTFRYFFAIVFSFIIFPPYLQAFEYSNKHENLELAEELFEATLFDEAISLYQILLEDPLIPKSNELVQNYIRIRLAEALFAEKKYSDAITCLENEKLEAYFHLNQTKLYLLALSHRNLENYEEAIIYFKKYLEAANSMLETHAKLELGICLFLIHRPQESRPYLESVVEKKLSDDDYYLAQLYLAKLDFLENKGLACIERLKSLETTMPKVHILISEVAYWQGKGFYELKNYPAAITYFEKALPKRNKEQADWHEDAIYNLGWTYLSQGNTLTGNQAEQTACYTKAESLFNQLIENHPLEAYYLALAKVYLSIFNHLEDLSAYTKANKILSQTDVFITPESRAHVFLLRANLEKSYELRNFYLTLLTDDSYQDTSFYAQGWLLRGLNDFEKAEKVIKTDRLEGIKLFDQAAFSLGQAYENLKKIESSQSITAAKLQAQAYIHQENTEAYLKAFNILKGMTQNFSDKVKSLPEAAEIYYLLGFVASRLSIKGDEFINAAKEYLNIVTKEFPESLYCSESLFILGGLLYKNKDYQQAEETFLTLLNNYPNFKYIADTYFWLAKCLAKQQKNSDEIIAYRRKVYEDFPTSKYAPEAYFNLFSYKSYLQSDKQATKHLLAFKEKFPNSPFLIHVHYLIGMDAKRDKKNPEGKTLRKKNLKVAIESFNSAEASFDHFFESGLLPVEDLNYFINLRYQCIMERALANLSIADDSQGAKQHIFLEYAEEVLQDICNEFKDSNHPLTKLFQKELYPKLLEESTYWLSQTYIKNQNDSKAQKILLEMLQNYKEAKITRGYFLSRTFYDLGLIAFRKQDYQNALKLFLQSEDAAKGKSISSDQKIDLWIQQSLCYREMEELDKSMLILSKAINDEAISSLRVKAMYLRAELYTLQGRQELARKQLESTSKNSGEWALKAKQKLEEAYGFQ